MTDDADAPKQMHIDMTTMSREELIAARPGLLEALASTGAIVLQRVVAGHLVAHMMPGQFEVPNEDAARFFDDFAAALEELAKDNRAKARMASDALRRLGKVTLS